MSRRFPGLPWRAAGPRGARAVEMLAGGAVEHLEQVMKIGLESPDWQLGESTENRLGIITLHYHAWAFSLAEAAAGGAGVSAAASRQAAALFRHYVEDWIRRCALERPGSTALAWNSYAIATRLGWWIRSYRLAREALFAERPAFEDLFLRSLWQQAAFLHDHLEWDLRANHLIRDLVGLALAGRFFEQEAAGRWLRRAGVLAREHGPAQVLNDGGHYERSPKYHLDVMNDVLDLALLTRDDAVRAGLRDLWAEMAEWAAWMRHPDGATSLFNDGSVVAGRTVESCLREGAVLSVDADASPRRGGRHFPDTGLVVWHGDPWTVFFDVGPVGPDEQPAHGHADTLSIECSFAGMRLVVDPGTHGYDADGRRRYDRGTAAHNTVVVDGRDSSEVWHIFRLGRRARPRQVSVDLRPDGFAAAASHDGYDHLPGRPRHRRTVELFGAGALEIGDAVGGGGAHRLRGGLLIGPDWDVEPAPRGWIATAGERRVIITVEGPDDLERFDEPGAYHPDYGVERRAHRIGWRRSGDLPCRVCWRLAAGG